MKIMKCLNVVILLSIITMVQSAAQQTTKAQCYVVVAPQAQANAAAVQQGVNAAPLSTVDPDNIPGAGDAAYNGDTQNMFLQNRPIYQRSNVAAALEAATGATKEKWKKFKKFRAKIMRREKKIRSKNFGLTLSTFRPYTHKQRDTATGNVLSALKAKTKNAVESYSGREKHLPLALTLTQVVAEMNRWQKKIHNKKRKNEERTLGRGWFNKHIVARMLDLKWNQQMNNFELEDDIDFPTCVQGATKDDISTALDNDTDQSFFELVLKGRFVGHLSVLIRQFTSRNGGLAIHCYKLHLHAPRRAQRRVTIEFKSIRCLREHDHVKASLENQDYAREYDQLGQSTGTKIGGIAHMYVRTSMQTILAAAKTAMQSYEQNPGHHTQGTYNMWTNSCQQYAKYFLVALNNNNAVTDLGESGLLELFRYRHQLVNEEFTTQCAAYFKECECALWEDQIPRASDKSKPAIEAMFKGQKCDE